MVSVRGGPGFLPDCASVALLRLLPGRSCAAWNHCLGARSDWAHTSILPAFFFCSTLRSRARLMWGRTPPKAIVALMSVSSSSSPRMASCRWRGVMRLTLRSFAAFPASSRTSAVRYSRTAVR